jgi:hypothetical protein
MKLLLGSAGSIWCLYIVSRLIPEVFDSTSCHLHRA